MPDRVNVVESSEPGATSLGPGQGMPRPGVTCTGNSLRPFSVSAAELLPTREDAEDATMEIFMKDSRQAGPIRFNAAVHRMALIAWPQIIAGTPCAAAKFARTKKPTTWKTVPLEHPDPNQLDRLIEKRSSEEVRKALDKLGSRARMALVMRYYSDMSLRRNCRFAWSAPRLCRPWCCSAPGMSCGKRSKAPARWRPRGRRVP